MAPIAACPLSRAILVRPQSGPSAPTSSLSRGTEPVRVFMTGAVFGQPLFRSGRLVAGGLTDRLVDFLIQLPIRLPDRQVVGDGGTKRLWIVGVVSHLIEHQ